MQWVVLNELSNGQKAGTAAESFLPSTPIALPDPYVEPLPIPVVASAPDHPSALSTAVDATAASKLLGRYMGQIDARVERAWIRPRSPIGAREFSCRARIVQDGGGNVTNVTLERCNGDTRWQRSLVYGIQSASPLPGPPDPRVFTHIIHLSFRSDPYSTAVAQELYEPEFMTVRAAEEARHDTQKILNDFRNALHNPQSNAGPIELRIEGSRSDGAAQQLRQPDTPEEPSQSDRSTQPGSESDTPQVPNNEQD